MSISTRRRDLLRQKLSLERKRSRRLAQTCEQMTSDLARLQRLEQRLLMLFELAPDGYFLSDLKGNLIDGNSAASLLFGFDKDELAGKNLLRSKIIVKNQVDRALAILQKNKAGSPSGPDEFELQRRDGSAITVELYTKPVEIEGEIIVFGVARDITLRKQAQAELDRQEKELKRQLEERTGKLSLANQELQQEIRERKEHEAALGASEEKLTNLIDVSTDLVFRLSKQKRIEFVSPNIKEKYGYLPEEVTGRSFNFLLPKSEIRKANTVLKKVLSGKPLHNFELRQKNRDNRIMTMEINAVPLHQDGKITGLQGVMRDITERREAERVLRESEEKYRDLVERADIGILIDDAEGNFKYFNKTFADFFGYSMDEMTGRNISDLIHPVHLPKVLRYHRERLRGLRTRSVYDFRGMRKDGSSIYVEVDVAPVKEADRITGTRSYIWDITKRKEAELALQKSEKRSRELYQNMREAVFIFDLSGKIQEWNPQFSKILGYTQEELQHLTWQDITAAEHVKTCEKIITTQVLRQSYSDLYETVFITSRRRKLPAEARMYLIRNDANEPSGFWVFFRDISAQKKIEQEVYMLAQTVKSVREYVCVTDLEDQILFVNDALLDTYGYERGELIGKHISILRAEKNDPAMLDELYQLSRRGGWEGDLMNRKSDGTEFPIFLSTSLIYDPAGNPLALVGVSSDISERKKIEAQLRQAQRMEAVGQLAGGIAHDFNNILTAINGYAELAFLRMEPKNPLFKEMTGILKAGRRAGSLVRQLLAFSRKQMIELHVLDVNRLIIDLDKMLRRLIGEDIQVEMKLDKGIRRIKADPGQIEQILVNLVVNARDAVNMRTETASEKSISIETINVELDRQFTQHHPGSQTGAHICITVSDTGIGMDELTKSKIFEPFFTTKDKIQGTGLGLATVYGIVKQNNGSIYVYSEPRRGTTIRVYWPCVAGTEDIQVAEPTSNDVKRGDETLLFVEDNPDVRDFTVEALKMLGYRVFDATNGRDALNVIKKDKHPIDLLITDVVMPEMGGRELAEHVRKTHPDTRILFTSGYTEHQIVHSGTLDQGIFFLHKPYSIESLSEKIREVLKRKK